MPKMSPTSACSVRQLPSISRYVRYRNCLPRRSFSSSSNVCSMFLRRVIITSPKLFTSIPATGFPSLPMTAINRRNINSIMTSHTIQGLAAVDDRVLRNFIGRWYGKPEEREKEINKDNWWKFQTIYQIYPRSFQDSNGDGIGDLRGIIQRLDYLKNLGIGIIWICPIYKSPMHDTGYDISNFREIEPMFGTTADFESLVKEAHSRGIRIIMDFVPNHTAAEHDWFQKSRRGIMPYKDYYVWHAGHPDKKVVDKHGKERPAPPNNWVSVFGGSMWAWDDMRHEYFLHQFMRDQPDLDFRNPDVLKEIEDIFRFWCDKGVDGFRIDALKHVFEEKELLDNHELEDPQRPTNNPDHYLYFQHEKTSNQPEVYKLMRGWRRMLDEYTTQHKREHILMIPECVEPNIKHVMRYYYDAGERCSDFPFNFLLMALGSFTGVDIATAVDAWLGNMPPSCWANWVLSTHDEARVASRVGTDRVDLLNALVLLMPGTPTTYYGEELGMVNNMDITIEQVQDKQTLEEHNLKDWRRFCRDFERTPMQWNAKPHAGFTTPEGKPWLPVAKNYTHLNVEAQLANPHSHLNFYKGLQRLRQQPSFAGNPFVKMLLVNQHVFAFERSAPGLPIYVIVLDCRSAHQFEREQVEKRKMLDIETAHDVKWQASSDEQTKQARALKRQSTREGGTQTDESKTDEIGLTQTDFQTLFGYSKAKVVLKSKSPVEHKDSAAVGDVVGMDKIYTFPSQVIVLQCEAT